MIIPRQCLQPPGASCVGLTPGVTGIKSLPLMGALIMFLVLILSALSSYPRCLWSSVWWGPQGRTDHKVPLRRTWNLPPVQPVISMLAQVPTGEQGCWNSRWLSLGSSCLVLTCPPGEGFFGPRLAQAGCVDAGKTPVVLAVGCITHPPTSPRKCTSHTLNGIKRKTCLWL